MGLNRIQNWYVYDSYPMSETSIADPNALYTDAENAYRLANWYNNYMTTYGVKK